MLIALDGWRFVYPVARQVGKLEVPAAAVFW